MKNLLGLEIESFLNVKFIILVGFILFVGLLYVLFNRFFDHYLSNEIKKVVDEARKQNEEFAVLKEESEGLNQQIIILNKKYKEKIDSIKKENELMIKQHKDISVMSSDDREQIKKYLDDKLNQKLVELQKNIITSSIQDIENDCKKNRKKVNIDSINKRLRVIIKG